MLTGQCLCSGVRIEVEGDIEHQPEACHCTQCRKHSGHILSAVNVKRSALKIEGGENVRWYRSSEKVERGFCGVCGSTLFWKPNIEGYDYTAVAMGLFDGETGLRLAKNTFVEDKGDYYDIESSIPQSAAY